jgi:glycosyltransferase involved in cell wall biosynthesis
MKTERRPLVTIGIPTYNRAQSYLREALESAITQTYPNIEIVVSDNGSTDDTEAVVRSYGDSRIRYIKQRPPVVPNDNFNFCLQQARGAYFLLLHDDDMVDPDFIETCLHAAGYRTDFGIIRTGVRIINTNSAVVSECANAVMGASFGEFFVGWFDGKTSIYLCNTLFNTQLLKDAGGFRSRHNLFQDVVALARLAAQAARVDVVAVKASARRHGGKWSRLAGIKAWCEDSLDLLTLLCDLAPEKAGELREKGLRFFTYSNYRRVNGLRSPVQRLLGYLMVYRFFERRYLPPMRMVYASTSLYRGLRHLKRRLLGLPGWVE